MQGLRGGEGTSRRPEVVPIKNDGAPRALPKRLRKCVLSAFNDYFILTGEFISSLHYRHRPGTGESSAAAEALAWEADGDE